MSIAILDRTPTGVLVKTLDVRGDRPVNQAVDDARATLLGLALIEWWTYGDLTPQGGKNWCGVVYHPGDPSTPGLLWDLRAKLLQALTADQRISVTAGLLRLTADHQPVVAVEATRRAADIGRDLDGWVDNPGRSRFIEAPGPMRNGQRLTARYDLRIGINQAVTGYEHQRDLLARRRAARGG